ncbi:MAG: hypothetical protein JOZ81_15080 [Chloroflexi bacterium]|nr:hypothetical protein [Chloroflexota bacterium]
MRHIPGGRLVRAGASVSLLVLLAACQAVPGPAPVSTSSTMTVWGQVPKQCNCHIEPLARVGNDLQASQLPVDFRLQNASAEGFQTFSVSFDPHQVSPDQVEHILQADGAAIIPAP